MFTRNRSRSQIRQHLSNILHEPQNEEDPAEDNEPNHANRGEAFHIPQEGDGRGEEESEDEEDGDVPPNRSHNPYNEGTTVVETPEFIMKVKSISHTRRTRYRLSDHLYSIWVELKRRHGQAPLLIDLEEALERALIHVLDELKRVYLNKQYQIYVTIIEKNIISGLNSGNYSLQTPSDKIARWMMGMLYNYLKSNQTLRLNNSFKIQIKVLSFSHVRNMEQNRPQFQRHIYH